MMPVQSRLAAVVAVVALAGCAVSRHTVANVSLPVPVDSLRVVLDMSCASPAVLPCQGDRHVEHEVSSAIEGVLLPALREAGIDAALVGGDTNVDGPVLRVRLLAVHHHYSVYNGSPITTPYVDLGLSLHANPGAPASWRTEFEERWPGIYIDVQPRYDALVRRLADASLEAVAPAAKNAGAH